MGLFVCLFLVNLPILRVAVREAESAAPDGKAGARAWQPGWGVHNTRERDLGIGGRGSGEEAGWAERAGWCWKALMHIEIRADLGVLAKALGETHV